MKKISVLIVDDSPLMRNIIEDILREEADIEVVGTAADPHDAREKIKKLNPQVITLDIEMPKMDGISFLEKIMSLRPSPVIMISTLTQKGAEETLRALEIGAVDFVSKPASGDIASTLTEMKSELPDKIRAAAASGICRGLRRKPCDETGRKYYPPFGDKPIIAVGASTGGVEALRDFFLALPRECPPVVVVQHMRPQFIPLMASRLSRISEVVVSEARNGDVLKPGHAYIAAGDQHLKIERRGARLVCRLDDSDRVSGHRPSVDVLFCSVAAAAGHDAVGIIMTGMGRDGAEGLLKMRRSGAHTIGQDLATCVVYGMPKAAMEAGAVQTELPLHRIAAHALDLCMEKKAGAHAGK